MKSTIIASILAACAGVSQATSSFVFYTGQNFSGKSAIGTFNTGVCNPMPSGFDNAVRSLGIENNNSADETCAFYNDAGCAGTTLSFNVPPGTKSTARATLPANVDRQISSFRCRI